jgi:hypothetical protein
VFRIKCAGRNNFSTNHFRSLAISGQGLFYADLYVSVAAVYIPPKGGSGAVFTADSVDPLLVIHEIALGQQEVCRLRLCLSETGKDPP